MLWFKALHLISIIAWFAGLLYLPRLFVYHVDCADAAGRARFEVMERRLYFFIMKPALLAVLLFGFILLGYGGISGLWLPVKLLLVVGLIVFHVYCGLYMRKLRSGAPVPSARFFRLFNEIPTALLIAIVVLAVVKPI